MKYKNAAEILPRRLLHELQSYAGGEILYVPRNGSKAKWGVASGSRSYYQERNRQIRQSHKAGISAGELAMQYGLSVYTIRKILYQ